MSLFKKLPYELLLEIMLFLPPNELYNVSITSKQLNDIYLLPYFQEKYIENHCPYDIKIHFDKLIKYNKLLHNFKLIDRGQISEHKEKLKITCEDNYIYMKNWRNIITKTLYSDVIIKNNYLKLFLPTFKYYYKFYAFSKHGYSFYDLFNILDKFRKISTIHYCKTYENVFYQEYQETGPSTMYWLNQTMSIINDKCDSLSLKKNSLIVYCNGS